MSIVTVELTELEKKILEHDVMSVQEWINDAIIGKINNCRKRIVRSHTQTLLDDPAVETIPATIDEICENLFNSPEYKNRAQREAESNGSQ